MRVKFNLEIFYTSLKTYHFYLASILFPILIVVPILMIDTFRPKYEIHSSVVMNEQILIDLRVLAGYLNPKNPFEVDGCKKVKIDSWVDYKAQIIPYSNKGTLTVDSRDLDEALEAMILWHSCSVRVFKRTIKPYEFELKTLEMIKKRIDLKSIDLKDINEYYKFRQSIINFELMNSYINEPFSYTTQKANISLRKYLNIYLAALAGFMTLLFVVYPLQKIKG